VPPPAAATSSFDRLLERSAAFYDHLGSIVDRFGSLAQGPRAEATGLACDISFEHATSLHFLFAAGAAASACALSRVQYEALLRAAWLLHGATDSQISRLAVELDPDSQQAAKNLPGAEKMLLELQRALDVHPHIAGLVVPLGQIREASWSAMNSFVHTGIHPLRRTAKGFPVSLADQVVRNSNAMMQLAVRLLYRVSAKPNVPPVEVERSYIGFEDCLPMLPPSP
jgi:hypothetical protein